MSFRSRVKSLAAAVLTFAVVLSFSGCNGEEGEESETTTEIPEGAETVAVTDESGNTVTNESGEPVYQMVEEEPVVYKVGFIYSGSVDCGGTNTVFEDARSRIKKTLGLDTCYIENVLVGDFANAVSVLKEDGCNIIVSCSPKFANSANKEAKFADGTFYLSFGGSSSSTFLSSFGGELYQTSAVCGIAAAYNTKSNVIGVIADPGEYNVYGVVDGFIIGASEIWGAFTDVRVNWAWSNDNSEIEAAVDDLIDQGCDIIMSYMDSSYPVKYCSDKPVKIIANCPDMPELAPDNYLTGYFFNFSTYLIDEIRSISNEYFLPKQYRGGIAEGTARLVDFGDACGEGTQDICERYYGYIRDRKALVFSGELSNSRGTIIVEKGQSMSFDNILKINWLVQGVRRTKDFTDVTQKPISSTFEIKGRTETETEPSDGGTTEQTESGSTDNGDTIEQ